MKMKKVLSIVIAVIIAMSSLVVVSNAAAPSADSPVIEMSVNKTAAKIGEIVKVEVKVDQSNICSATLDLVYDNACFEVVSMAGTGAMNEEHCNTAYSTNRARYTGVCAEYVENAATLFTAELKVTKPGGKIVLEVEEVYHVSLLQKYDVTSDVKSDLKNGTVTIVCSHANSVTDVKDATCTADGSSTVKCNDCGKTETTVIPMLPHDKVETVIEEPTCSKEGLKTEVCKNCGWKAEDVAIAKLPHNTEEKVIKEPTCSEDGEKAQVCKDCGAKSDSTPIEKLPHDSEEVLVKAATCEAEGKKAQKCKVCGTLTDEVSIPAKGHTPGEWEVVKQATKTERGLEQKKCTTCGKVVEEKEIPMLVSYKLGDVNNDGTITAVDARMVLRYVAGLTEFTDAQQLAADTTKDGSIGAVDARVILQVVAGLTKI